MELILELEFWGSLRKSEAGAELSLPKDDSAEEMKEGKIGCETVLPATDADSEGGGDTTDCALGLVG